ncbi:hypothetical protein ACL02R_13960 [Streptomyces sp. MS19]|uniref:hypothetical protein n=1 Tax=Streptomyces sp. MS19 TaxID=3385972 RepID=UPI0039A00D37
MAGKHAGGDEGSEDDRLPGQPWVPDAEPTSDGNTPSGTGKRRESEQDEDGR